MCEVYKYRDVIILKEYKKFSLKAAVYYILINKLLIIMINSINSWFDILCKLHTYV